MENPIDMSMAKRLGLIRYDHQQTGVEWALEQEHNNFNRVSNGGMITDEMGLGKTYNYFQLLFQTSNGLHSLFYLGR